MKILRMLQRLRSNSGFALVSTLIVVAVLAILIAGLMTTVKTGFRFGGLFLKKSSRENIAESGINRIHKILIDQAVQENDRFFAQFNAYPEQAVHVTSPVGVSGEDGIYKWDTYIIAKEGNPLTLDVPMKFRIVSIITHKATGEKYTVETMSVIQPISYAKFAYAILKPVDRYPTWVATPPATWTQWWTRRNQFEFGPNAYDGWVHFGVFPSGTLPLLSCGNFQFLGPVTFDAPGNGVPGDNGVNSLYFAGSCGEIHFRQGFIPNFHVTLDYTDSDATVPGPRDIFQKIRSNLTPAVHNDDWINPSGTEVCLFFKDYVVERWSCERTFPNFDPASGLTITDKKQFFLHRYKNKLGEITIPPDGNLVLYSNKDIGVKGIYAFPLTVASYRDIRIEGDFIQRCQGRCQAPAGLVAGRNILIPHYVPNGNAKETDYRSYVGWDLVNGVTNFDSRWNFSSNTIVAGSNVDRDSGKADYSAPQSAAEIDRCHCSTNGCCNLPWVLDIEASMFAMGNDPDPDSGKLKMEGLGEWSIDPSGRVIVDLDGNLRPKSLSNAQSLTMDTNGDGFADAWRFPLDPNARPLYWEDIDLLYRPADTDKVRGLIDQFDPLVQPLNILPSTPTGNSPDPDFWEIKSRPYLNRLWLFGGYIVKDFSPLGTGNCPDFTTGVCGAWHRNFFYDTSFDLMQPPAFPHAAKYEALEISRKSYTGAPDLVEAPPLPSPIPSPSPTPVPTPDCSSGTCRYSF